MQQVRTALGPQPLTPQTEKGESPMSENRQVLENEKLLVEITPAGAELTRICDKKNGQEMLWEGDPAVWGRHSPILFPFCGEELREPVSPGRGRLLHRPARICQRYGV